MVDELVGRLHLLDQHLLCLDGSHDRGHLIHLGIILPLRRKTPLKILDIVCLLDVQPHLGVILEALGALGMVFNFAALELLT